MYTVVYQYCKQICCVLFFVKNYEKNFLHLILFHFEISLHNLYFRSILKNLLMPRHELPKIYKAKKNAKGAKLRKGETERATHFYLVWVEYLIAANDFT